MAGFELTSWMKGSIISIVSLVGLYEFVLWEGNRTIDLTMGNSWLFGIVIVGIIGAIVGLLLERFD